MNTDTLIDLTEDMYTGSLPCIENFTCMICYGIVFNPIKCKGCETLFCKNCFMANRSKYCKNKMNCYKKCGSSEYFWKLDKLEQSILNALIFECQDPEC